MTVIEERYMESVPSILKDIYHQMRIANELKILELSAKAKETNDEDLIDAIHNLVEQH